MPKPAILPIPDRRAIFLSGKTYDEWLASADEPDQAERIRSVSEEIRLSSVTIAVLESLVRPVNIIAIAETWCGDVVRHTPLVMAMVEAAGGIVAIRFIARNDFPDFFIRFLTNGGEAVPKFVFCNDDFVEVGNWGPMSATPRLYIAIGKAVADLTAARKKVSAFYEHDERKEATAELLTLFKITGLSVL